jgi:hypothetical protein
MAVILLGLSREGKTHVEGCLKDTVLRRIFGAKRSELTGGWRKLRQGKKAPFRFGR